MAECNQPTDVREHERLARQSIDEALVNMRLGFWDDAIKELRRAIVDLEYLRDD